MKTSSAICKETAERDAIAEHQIHMKKLLNIKARVDNKPPRVMPHVNKKAKKELEELKIQAEIQWNNQILLQKLKKIEIHSTKNSGSPRPLSITMNRIRIDEMIRIGDENNKILDKIKSAKSHYSTRKLREQYIHRKYLSRKLSENARRFTKTITFRTNDSREMADLGNEYKPLRTSILSSENTKQRLQRPISAKPKYDGF